MWFRQNFRFFMFFLVNCPSAVYLFGKIYFSLLPIRSIVFWSLVLSIKCLSAIYSFVQLIFVHISIRSLVFRLYVLQLFSDSSQSFHSGLLDTEKNL